MIFVTDEKRNYIKTLNAALAPLLDFDKCEYALSDITQEEFMKISDKLGSVAYFDITGMTCGEILKEVCKAVLIDQISFVPESVITNIEKKRKVAALFRR